MNQTSTKETLMFRHSSVALVGATALALAALSACGTDSSAPAAEDASAQSATAAGTLPTETTMSTGTLIDVRTPEEYAEGHLNGAINVDFNSPTFADDVAGFDKEGNYTLYCRSGNRSAQAIAQMERMGFTNLTNAGGYEEASKNLGIEIVK